MKNHKDNGRSVYAAQARQARALEWLAVVVLIFASALIAYATVGLLYDVRPEPIPAPITQPAPAHGLPLATGPDAK